MLSTNQSTLYCWRLKKIKKKNLPSASSIFHIDLLHNGTFDKKKKKMSVLLFIYLIYWTSKNNIFLCVEKKYSNKLFLKNKTLFVLIGQSGESPAQAYWDYLNTHSSALRYVQHLHTVGLYQHCSSLPTNGCSSETTHSLQQQNNGRQPAESGGQHFVTGSWERWKVW